MNTLARGLAAVALAITFPAGAEIYRCELNGKLTFTDRPCAVGAEPLELKKPIEMETAPGEAQLARDYDRRLAREVRGRGQGTAERADAYAARKAKAERIRAARLKGRVAQGMTPQDVRYVLGEPQTVTQSESQGVSRETWTYKEAGGTTQTVQFKNGEVSSSKTGRKKRR